MEKVYSDIVAFNQDTIDTFVKTNAVVAKSFETMTKHFADFATKSFEDAVDAGKKLASCKSISEAIQFQTKFIQESVETLIDEGKKVQDMSASIVKEVTSPFAERFKAGVATVAVVPKTAARKAA